MATNVSATQLDGLYKEVYGDAPPILVPELGKLYKAIPFAEDARVGKTYNQPVVLQLEQGYTYGGSNGDAFAISTPIATLMDNASLEGSEGLLATRMSYRAAAKAASSKAAFKKAMNVSMESHQRSHVMRRELELLYGRSPTGLATTSAGNADSSTQETLTITAASWAVGIWAGMEGATLNAFRIDTGALISSAADAIFSLSSVDPDNKKITLTGTATGCTALHAQAAQLYLDFAGTRATMTTTHTCFEGLDYAITLASGNTLWGIPTSYTLWRGNSYSAASARLTGGKIVKAANVAVGKAGLDEALNAYVSPATWADLSDSLSAKRQLDASYSTSEGKDGVEKIVHFGANGAINVIIHPIVKEGEAWLLPMKHLKRVGSTDITMNNPASGEKIFFELPSNAGFEYRSYSDFSLFVDAPGKLVKITNITNAA